MTVIISVKKIYLLHWPNKLLVYDDRLENGRSIIPKRVRRPFKCTQCPRSYGNVYHLKFHSRSQTTKKYKKCPECGKVCTTTALNRHLISLLTQRRASTCATFATMQRVILMTWKFISESILAKGHTTALSVQKHSSPRFISMTILSLTVESRGTSATFVTIQLARKFNLILHYSWILYIYLSYVH